MLHGFPHLSSVLDALPHPHASFLACGSLSLDIKDAHGQSLCDWTDLSNDTLSSFWRSLVHFPPSSSHQKRRAIISPFNHCRSRSRPPTHMPSSSSLLCLPLFFLSHLSSQTNQRTFISLYHFPRLSGATRTAFQSTRLPCHFLYQIRLRNIYPSIPLNSSMYNTKGTQNREGRRIIVYVFAGIKLNRTMARSIAQSIVIVLYPIDRAIYVTHYFSRSALEVWTLDSGLSSFLEGYTSTYNVHTLQSFWRFVFSAARLTESLLTSNETRLLLVSTLHARALIDSPHDHMHKEGIITHSVINSER